nr:exodeoxyribonuclease V subunit gamma [Stutzerimonas stutzeri]
GRDPRDNAQLPPSVLLSEVLEAVDLTAVLPDGGKASERISIAHPLQPFAPGNFASGGFSGSWFRAAQRLAEPPQLPPPFTSRLAEPDAAWLTIEPSQLLQCFRHPSRFLLEQRLGLRLADSRETLASDEPFELEMPAWNGLRRLSLQALEHGWSDAEERRMACAAGWLPPGEVGQALWGKLRGPVRAFAPRLFELRPSEVPEPLPVDITLAGVRIHGWLDGVTPGGLFGWKLGRLGEWDLAPFWLRHLLLNLSATPGIERNSLMLSPTGDWQLGPLANAAELLEPWLLAYRDAICEPLPLLPRSSHAFAKGWRHPSRGSEPLDTARKRAREAWLGGEFSPIAAECEDPWNALAFRDREPLDERFEALAEQLIGPILDALAADEEDDA